MKKTFLLGGVLVALAGAAFAQVRFDDVVRNLRNPDPKARLQSIELLRASKYVEAIAPIAPLVNDPVDAVQLAAIEAELSFFAVDEISARRRVALIVEVRGGGKGETAFAAGPLAVWPRTPPAELLTNLLEALDDENRKVRVEAIYTFGALAQAPVADEHARRLVTALDHYDPAIRHAAARVIGRLRVATAGEALIKTVNDSQEPVRFAAMRALGEVREAKAITALAQQVEYYRTGEGAWSALEGLARIGHSSSVALFRTRLLDRDPFMRRAAAEGLGRAGASGDIAALEAAATADSSEMVRAAAAFALHLLGRNEVARLVNALRSERMAPQVAGYFLELGPATAAALVPHLKDPADSVRGNVAVILGGIGSSRDVAALEPLLLDRSRDVVRAATRAIERIKLRGA